MLLHENTLVSLDLLEKEFVCNISACKGACCIEGDSGAPLEMSEIDTISEQIEQIKPFMEAAAINLLNEKGFYEKDTDGDLVTTAPIAALLKKQTMPGKLTSKNQYHAICIPSGFQRQGIIMP